MSMATRLPEISEQGWELCDEASRSHCNLSVRPVPFTGLRLLLIPSVLKVYPVVIYDRAPVIRPAANWIALGKTTGRGLKATTNSVKGTIKTVYGYALVRDFREKLGVSGELKQSIK